MGPGAAVGWEKRKGVKKTALGEIEMSAKTKAGSPGHTDLSSVWAVHKKRKC